MEILLENKIRRYSDYVSWRKENPIEAKKMPGLSRVSKLKNFPGWEELKKLIDNEKLMDNEKMTWFIILACLWVHSSEISRGVSLPSIS